MTGISNLAALAMAVVVVGPAQGVEFAPVGARGRLTVPCGFDSRSEIVGSPDKVDDLRQWAVKRNAEVVAEPVARKPIRCRFSAQ